MRLHRLGLTDFKAIQTREVVFPDSGVLVVEGRNEVGKTSMIEALDLLFEHKDSSRRAEIRAAQPVGTDVGPRVEIEMSTGPYRFTYLKQWCRAPRTELHILHPRVEQLTGEAAHHRARAILAETVDLPLWRALRLMQASPLVPTEFATSSSLSAALDAAAGSAHDAGPAGESLLAAAEEACLRYFTARNLTPTGEYKLAIDRLEAAAEQVRCAERALEEVAHDVDLHERLCSERQARVGRRAEAWERRAEVGDRFASVSALREALREAERGRDHAQHDLDRAVERRDERNRLVAGVRARAESVAAHADAVTELRDQVSPREEELRAARAAHEHATAQEARARISYDEASAAVSRRRDRSDLSALQQRLARIDVAVRRRGEAAAALAANQVTSQVWKRVEAAAREVDLAAAAVAAGSASVTVESLAGEQMVEIDGEQVAVRGSASLSRPVTDRVELVVPGQLRFVVRPEANASQRAATVEAARADLRRQLTRAGVNDVEQARERHEQRRAAQAEHDRAQEWLEDLLDGDERGDLLDRLEVLTASCARYPDTSAVNCARPEGDSGVVDGASRSIPAGRRGRAPAAQAGFGAQALPIDFGSEPGIEDAVQTSLPDEAQAVRDVQPGHESVGAVQAPGSPSPEPVGPFEPVDVEQARRSADDARDEAQRCARRVESIRSAVDAQRLELARAESLLAAVKDELGGQQERLVALRDQDADEVLDDQVVAATRQVEAAQQVVHERQAEMGGVDAAELEAEVCALDTELAALDSARRDLDDEIIRVEARLEQAGGQGRAETFDAARTELERATRAHETISRHANAARLLHTTLQQQSQSAKATYVRPFTQAVQRLGQLVYGPSFEVEVDEKLVVVARVLDGRRIPYAALSTGAKEQLAILTRLACAGIVDAGSGVPVIIDDALGHSDPDKLRRVCAAFGRVEASAQVVLLTCTPGRYAAIGDATVVRL